jgi:hypothetical protein
MTFSFPVTATLGSGHFPQAVHMMDNTMHVFYLTDSGDMNSLNGVPPLGIFDDLPMTEAGQVASDQNIVDPKLRKIAYFGACGFWSSHTDHKFISYSLPFDLSDVLNDGNTQVSIDSPITQLSFTANNVNSFIMGKYRSSVTPGVKIVLSFKMGGSDPYSMGVFFADRVEGRREEATVSISGRNNTGKLLKEQTFDDTASFTSGHLQDNLIAILQLAGIDDYFVGETALTWNLAFDPDTAILDGLQSVVQMISGWKISENADGTIGIGPSTDSRFDQPGTFTFQRDSTCWSCDASQDDQDSYSKICIRCSNPAISTYRLLGPNPYWPVPGNKTLYVDVPDGTTINQMQDYADELADSVSITGRLETFAGIYTPQLLIGDSAEVVEADGRSSIAGTVTTVAHYFGRSGFYTQFTVDSGGRIGKPMLKDYLSTVSGQNTQTKVTIS